MDFQLNFGSQSALKMNKNQEQLEALQDIRQMMKQSNRFLSLSGLSGVFAGFYAIAGAYVGHQVIYGSDPYSRSSLSDPDYKNTITACVGICLLVLGLSLITALLFSKVKAKKYGYKLFDHTAWRLMINMLVPLMAGGLFCLALLYHGRGSVMFVAPVMLMFYGVALVNGSKYTLHDIRYLGYLEILLGVLASFYIGSGLLFWTIGFGVLHIIYGGIMWFKYDRK
jgi:hypothetical protein